MAPEVIRGARAGKAADLWSLGVVAHILLTHTHPFYGGYDDRVDEVEALERLDSGPLALGGDAPADLRRLIERSLELEPDARGTALGLFAELDAVWALTTRH